MKDSNFNNNWPFKKINYLLFGLGISIIIVGYIIMAIGEVNSFQSIKFAPFLLCLGYFILIPLSIFYSE